MNLVVTVITLVAGWMLFKKMGRQGWEGIIPFYNLYVLFEELEGAGSKMLWLFVPFVNIYWIIRINIDLAHAFNKNTGFGIGLIVLNPVFSCILAFDGSVYLDGTYGNEEEDFVSDITNKFTEATGINFGKDPNALEKIEKLREMYLDGLLSEEEFEAKKKDLLKRL